MLVMCVFFSKAKEKWGEFGNMTGGFPFRVLSCRIMEKPVCSTESLYQAMRFTEYPDIQKEILSAGGGMGAKMASKKYRNTYTRADFEEVKMDIMMWVLRLKLANHTKTFGEVLLETGDREIVEFSKKDDFWGAKPSEDGLTVTGHNILGELLMILREEYRTCVTEGTTHYKMIVPPSIPNFTLLGHSVSPF